MRWVELPQKEYPTRQNDSGQHLKSSYYIFLVGTVLTQINVSHIKDISQINNIVDADQKSIYYINASQINDNLTLTIDLPLTNNIVNLRFDCI